MKKVSVNGISLSYDRYGSGTPLFLLHGYPLDHTIWDEVGPLLKDAFDVILPDLRGFGGSSTVETPYTMNDYATDLIGLIDQLELDKAAFAGHSMGGYVALALAKKFPKRVSGLALVSSQAGADAPDGKERRYKTAQDVAEKGIGVVVDAMTSKFSANEKVQSIARKVMERQSKSGVIGALKAMAEREDTTSLLAAFSFPLVLIHGDADALIPVDRAREMKTLQPAAQLVEFKGAGHVTMLEDPQGTAGALRKLQS